MGRVVKGGGTIYKYCRWCQQWCHRDEMINIPGGKRCASCVDKRNESPQKVRPKVYKKTRR